MFRIDFLKSHIVVDYKKKKTDTVGVVMLEHPNGEKVAKAFATSVIFNKNDNALRSGRAVLKPSAQITKLCDCRSSANTTDLSQAFDKLEILRENRVLTLVIRLMLLHGLRVSEALYITPQCVMRNGSVFVRGLKGSKDRVVSDSARIDEWLLFKKMNVNDLIYFDRYYVYRIFKKLGLYAVYGTNRNNSVTHSPRHNVALGLREEGLSVENIQDVLGHKSVKSTEFYVRDKK
jgi:site-specific recombinase XerD